MSTPKKSLSASEEFLFKYLNRYPDDDRTGKDCISRSLRLIDELGVEVKSRQPNGNIMKKLKAGLTTVKIMQLYLKELDKHRKGQDLTANQEKMYELEGRFFEISSIFSKNWDLAEYSGMFVGGGLVRAAAARAHLDFQEQVKLDIEQWMTHGVEMEGYFGSPERVEQAKTLVTKAFEAMQSQMLDVFESLSKYEHWVNVQLDDLCFGVSRSDQSGLCVLEKLCFLVNLDDVSQHKLFERLKQEHVLGDDKVEQWVRWCKDLPRDQYPESDMAVREACSLLKALKVALIHEQREQGVADAQRAERVNKIMQDWPFLVKYSQAHPYLFMARTSNEVLSLTSAKGDIWRYMNQLPSLEELKQYVPGTDLESIDDLLDVLQIQEGKKAPKGPKT